MKERITHHSSRRLCVFFHIRVWLYFALVFFLVIPVTIGFATERPESEALSPPLKSEPIYIMPNQAGAFLQFGVAITPDPYIRSMDNHLSASYFNSFDKNDKIVQHADVSTVVRIALDEFKFFSGVNTWVQFMEKKMNRYSRKFMLTGELNIDPRNTDPRDYLQKVNLAGEIFKGHNAATGHRNYIRSILSQFEVNKVTWNMGLHFGNPEITFKLGIGEAFMIQSSAGEDVRVGAMVKLSI